VTQRPACQLKELHGSRAKSSERRFSNNNESFDGSFLNLHCFHAGHQFSERNHLFVDTENPSFDVGVVHVRYMVDGEDGPVFFRVSTFGPESWVGLLLASGR
jgi:hypothetical protein